jgi:hypothetical protein
MLMFPIPQIRITTTPARLRIDADLGRFEIKQPPPEFKLRQIPAEMRIEQPKGSMHIDQSKAWDALGRANILEVMHRIYDQSRQLALEGIARIAQEGDRLMDITREPNAVANMAAEKMTMSFPQFDYAGEASYDNVEIRYEARKPVIEVQLGGVQLESHPNKPEITYHRGKMDIRVLRYSRVDITPPVIDLRI